eukprot:6181359-Pleurochrysis_carterae.AAC.2
MPKDWSMVRRCVFRERVAAFFGGALQPRALEHCSLSLPRSPASACRRSTSCARSKAHSRH